MKQFFIYYLFILIIFSSVSILLLIRFKKIPPKLFYSFLLILTIPLLLGYLIYIYILPAPESLVPNVIRYRERTAIGMLESAKLVPVTEERTGNGDVVSKQRPEAGMRVKKGRKVFLKVGKPIKNDE
jgi:beta-lactam-binding protein with PASTA domain